MIFKCKICGGSLDVKQDEKIAVCEYCGVWQSVPSFIGPKIQEIYDRANSYLTHNEFDKAENLYNQILFDNKEDADAYWNVLMCRYGVTYVKDPSSGKYIPTCNRTLYTPIFNDENYQNAIKYADEKQKELYAQNAKTIDEIQKGILAVSKKEKPFDIFISYKETGENGGRTKDSIVAQELYDKLTAEGYKVFFSRITLEDKIGTEYEPYIYAALASSKVMITISSSKENLEAVWVKNEWSRFLSFANKDSEKTLIPLYFDMDKADLPDDFALLSAYDMKANGFEQELIRGIKKLIPLPVMLLERKKKFRKRMKFVGIGVAIAAAIGLVFAIPWFAKMPAYNQAKQLYYDKNFPEATWAFAELGTYRDADEMKEKCEKSWRNTLAVVVAEPPAYACSYNHYYISDNGSVKQYNDNDSATVDHSVDHTVESVSINEHGKIVSLAWGYEPYALYEDGTVQLSQNDGEIWTEIIQIVVGQQLIGLRADGRVIYEKTHTTYGDNTEQDWLKETEKWDNIVALDYDDFGGSGSILIGIMSNGEICKVQTGPVRDISVANYRNIEKISVVDGNLCAITHDGKITFGNNGSITEYKADSVKAAEIYGNAYDSLKHYCELTTNGKLLLDDRYALGEICYLKKGYALSKTGVLYRYDISENMFAEVKSNVFVNTEWK